MGRRWRKQKAGQQKGKARKFHAGESGAGSAGGTMSRFRQGLKSVAGSGSKGTAKRTSARILDVALWAAVVLMLVFVIGRRCR